MTLRLTQGQHADLVLSSDGFALLMGMLLDQHIR